MKKQIIEKNLTKAGYLIEKTGDWPGLQTPRGLKCWKVFNLEIQILADGQKTWDQIDLFQQKIEILIGFRAAMQSSVSIR